MNCSPPGLSVHGDSPGKNTRSGLPCPPLGDLPNPGIELRSHTLQVDAAPEDLPDSGTEPMSPALQVDSLPLSHQETLQVDSLQSEPPRKSIKTYDHLQLKKNT